MIHLWEIFTAASARGNALHQPLRGTDPMPLTRLLDRAERTAADVLAALRGAPPQRLGVLADNGEPWLRGAFAALRLDAAFVPLPRAVGFVGAEAYVEHVRRIVAAAGLDAVLVDDTTSRPMAARVAAGLAPVPLIDASEPVAARPPAAAPSRGDDALAVVQYTSGSTSAPKGVTLSHRNVATGLAALTGGLGFRDGDAFGVWVPLFHDMGLFTTLSGLAAGASVCLWRPTEFVRRPLDWLSSFAASPATVLTAPNFCFDHLVKAARHAAPPADLDLSGWRLAANGAEPVHRRTLAAFDEVFGPYGLAPTTLAPAYGMAEATLIVSGPDPGRTWHTLSVDRAALRIGDHVVPRPEGAAGARNVVACGRAAPALSLRVADEAGAAFPDGVVGEIQITGPAVTGGYLGVPEAAQPFTPDRWLRTGDLGFLIDGDLYVTGRVKDMITVRGQNFYAEDVEEIVRATPGVDRPRNAAIAWDDDAGERMVVLLETSLDGAAARALAGTVRERIKIHLGLEAAEVVPVPPATIPHTTSGKVKRHAAGRILADRET